MREMTMKAMRNQRGAAMPFVALTTVAILGMTALAVDAGMLFTARGEAQRAADAAALAGAGALIMAPQNSTRAHTAATNYGEQNLVRDELVQMEAEDITIDLAQGRVTAVVRREASRGNAVTTWFARVLGTTEVDVDARAVAEVQDAGRARCVKPFAIPDRFDDVDGDGVFDPEDSYDPHVHGYGSDWRNSGSPGSDGLGYHNDIGRAVALKEGGAGNHQPSWYYPWDMPLGGGPTTGADRYRWNIANCNPNIISIGEEYMVETGNMQGPTRHGTEDAMALDGNALWDAFNNEVSGSGEGNNWEASKRIVTIPVFDPSRTFDPGNQPIEFSNFIAVFVQSITGNGNGQRVNGFILPAKGLGGGSGTGPGIKVVRLIE
jgi:Flp pilus assembly protein TadG